MASPSAILVGHTSSVWCSSFTPDGSHIATCSSDETTRVWTLLPDLVRGQEAVCLNEHAGVVRGCDFSPDSTLLATCSWDKCVHIHTTASSNFMLQSKFLGHRYGVSCVKFTPSGSGLVSCSWDDTIGLWDVRTGTLLSWLKGHTSPVASCTFLQDTILVSCSWDGTVKLWDLSLPHQAAITLIGHTDAVYSISASSLDPNLLASCGRKGMLILWDIRTQVPWQVLQKSWMELNCVCFSPSGSHFITGDSMGELYLWDMDIIKSSSISAIQPTVLQAHANGVCGVSFSGDGNYLASCSNDYTCRIWDTRYAFEPSVASLADALENQLSLRGN